MEKAPWVVRRWSAGKRGLNEAVLVSGLDGLALDPKEVLEARLFSPGNLPDGMPEAHRDLAASL